MTRTNVFRNGHVAVVTGAALGIGRAMCERFAELGMNVVMADLAGSDLDAAAETVRAKSSAGSDAVLVIATDVASPAEIAELHKRTLAAFGKVNVLANNAVTRIGRGFAADIADWRQAMEVNLWGPVNAVNAFRPAMMASAEPGVIINVGSKQGITNPPGHPIYNMTKAALKTYTEALEHELRSAPDNMGDGRVTAHLLVPGWTTTGRNEHKPGAWLPEQVASTMIGAVTAGDFYIICPDDETTPEADRKRIIWGARDITENRPPLSRWHPDFAELAKRECS